MKKGYLMKFTVNQHHDTSVSLMTDMGYVLGYFTSIDEAIDTCNEWYLSNSRELKHDVKVVPLITANADNNFMSYFSF